MQGPLWGQGTGCDKTGFSKATPARSHGGHVLHVHSPHRPGWEALISDKKLAVLSPQIHRSGVQLSAQGQRELTPCHLLSQEPRCAHGKSLQPQPSTAAVCHIPTCLPLTPRPSPEERTNRSPAFMALTAVGQTLLQLLSVIRGYKDVEGRVSPRQVSCLCRIAAHTTSFLFLLFRKAGPTPSPHDPEVPWCHGEVQTRLDPGPERPQTARLSCFFALQSCMRGSMFLSMERGKPYLPGSSPSANGLG